MLKKNLSSLALILLALALGCTAAGSGTTNAGDKTDPTAQVDVNEIASKITDVEVTDISDLFEVSFDKRRAPARRLMSTPGSFERYFGFPAPTEIDFNSEWVVFATAGIKRSGGYNTSLKVTMNESGRSIRARVVTGTPGRGCPAISVITAPYFVGTIPAGAGNNVLPSSIRYYDEIKSGRSCVPEPTCGAGLVAELADSATFGGEEVLATSEADYPYLPVNLGPAPDAVNIASVAKAALTSGALDAYIAERREYDDAFPTDADQLLTLLLDDEQGGNEDPDAYSSDDGDFGDWRDSVNEADADESEWSDYERQHILGHRQLAKAIAANLTDVKLVYLFDVDVQLFIVGRSACGELIGYHTRLIWT